MTCGGRWSCRAAGPKSRVREFDRHRHLGLACDFQGRAKRGEVARRIAVRCRFGCACRFVRGVCRSAVLLSVGCGLSLRSRCSRCHLQSAERGIGGLGRPPLPRLPQRRRSADDDSAGFSRGGPCGHPSNGAGHGRSGLFAGLFPPHPPSRAEVNVARNFRQTAMAWRCPMQMYAVGDENCHRSP